MLTAATMDRGQVIAIALVVCSLIISGVSPCSVTDDWKAQPVTQRISQAKIVVYGYVTAHYPTAEADGMIWPNDQVYTAEVELYCIFKGGPLPDRINVSYVGEYTSCSVTELPLGEDYIILLHKQGQDYLPHEVNIQTAAFLPTDANFYYVSKDPDVTVSEDACTNNSGNNTIACFETGTDHESCDGVGGLRANSLAWYIMALLTWACVRWIG